MENIANDPGNASREPGRVCPLLLLPRTEFCDLLLRRLQFSILRSGRSIHLRPNCRSEEPQKFCVFWVVWCHKLCGDEGENCVSEMGATDFAVGVVGALVLAHAAYSTVLCMLSLNPFSVSLGLDVFGFFCCFVSCCSWGRGLELLECTSFRKPHLCMMRRWCNMLSVTVLLT